MTENNTEGSSQYLLAKTCQDCGKVSRKTMSSCEQVPCQHGNVVVDDSTGNSACTSCAAGKSQLFPGKTTCQDCKAGYYGDKAGLLKCIKCAAGSYSSSTGQTVCSSCAAGKSSASGSNTCTDCAVGKYSTAGGLCTSCVEGKYSDVVGATRCSAGTGRGDGPDRDDSVVAGASGPDDQIGLTDGPYYRFRHGQS